MKKILLLCSLVLSINFIGCGTGSDVSIKSPEITLIKKTKYREDNTVEQMVVYENKNKSIETLYNEEGNITQITTSESTYEDKQKHISTQDTTIEYAHDGQIIASTKKICLSQYDSEARYLGESCEALKEEFDTSKKSTTTSEIIISYNDNRPTELREYLNGNLIKQRTTLAWDNNKPIRSEVSYIPGGYLQVFDINYTGENKTLMISDDIYRDRNTRTYDTKNNPYYTKQDNRSSVYRLFRILDDDLSQNNLLETYDMFGLYVKITKFKIIYNDDDFPIRVDETIRVPEPDYDRISKSYTTYEYTKVE